MDLSVLNGADILAHAVTSRIDPNAVVDDPVNITASVWISVPSSCCQASLDSVGSMIRLVLVVHTGNSQSIGGRIETAILF